VQFPGTAEEQSLALDASPLTLIALGCAVVSATILVGFLVRRPALTRATKVALLFGLGVFPIGAAAASNVVGFEGTKNRQFCGSCHVMALHRDDSNDLTSGSLSSRHGRNALFGGQNCYTCHADYGMFGTVLTKLGGMRHVWLYYTQYRTTPMAEAKETIHLRQPFPNENCMQCHSTETTLWLKVPDHRAGLKDVRSDRISCASVGCHGFAHPNFRPAADDAGNPPPQAAGGKP
jgi:NapC/NirT cytochrome c family, N-terminal region